MVITNRGKIVKEIKNIEELENYIREIDLHKIKKIPKNILQLVEKKINETNQIAKKEFARKFFKGFLRFKTHLNVNFWIERGYEEVEANKKVFEIQSKNANKYVKKHLALKKENYIEWAKKRKITIEYWKNLGLSEEDAKEKLREWQDRRSRKRNIKKYGEKEGNRRVDEINKKWMNSLYFGKTKEEIEKYNKSKAVTVESFIKKYGKDGIQLYSEYCKKKTRNWKCFTHSKWSDSLIQEIINKFNLQNILCYPNEYSLYDFDKNKNYYYDFTDLENKIIIEFNGRTFHPNKEILNEQQWKNWKNPYSNLTADMIFDYDKKKIETAEESEFKTLVIWDNKSNIENLEIINNFYKQNFINERNRN